MARLCGQCRPKSFSRCDMHLASALGSLAWASATALERHQLRVAILGDPTTQVSRDDFGRAVLPEDHPSSGPPVGCRPTPISSASIPAQCTHRCNAVSSAWGAPFMSCRMAGRTSPAPSSRRTCGCCTVMPLLVAELLAVALPCPSPEAFPAPSTISRRTLSMRASQSAAPQWEPATARPPPLPVTHGRRHALVQQGAP